MTPLLAVLLLGLLPAEFPDNYHPLIFIFPNSEYGFILSLAFKFILALQFRKTLFQLIVHHIIHLYISFSSYPYCKYFMHSGISKLVTLFHTT